MRSVPVGICRWSARAAALCVSTWVAAGTAHAYDFEIDATATGQAYQLRWFQPSGADRVVNIRRFTQSLGLSLWNLLEHTPDPGHPDRKPKKPPADVYFTSSMRLDHDFGSFTQGRVTHGDPAEVDPAKQLSPELGAMDLRLEVLYAYLGVRDLGGFVDLQLGRQMQVSELDWTSFDGLTLRAKTPWWITAEASGGLRVRSETGWLGSDTFEPDGTQGASCRTFDALAAMPDYVPAPGCAQREELMPTYGGALELAGPRWASARVSYRRTFSRSPAGLYPVVGLPEWGVNEERAVASARLNLWGGRIIPWGAARWNFLVAQVDEAHAGVRVGGERWSVTPEWAYSYPSFDGDSIFLVFTQFGYHDLRLTLDVGTSKLGGYVRGFVRQFRNTDTAELAVGEEIEVVTRSAGGALGGRFRASRNLRLRSDLFVEGGFGGQKVGGDVSARWTITRTISGEGRATVMRFDEDQLTGLEGTTFGAQAGGRWVLTEGIALHLLVEDNANQFIENQLRVMALLDLAFRPEL